MFQAEESVSPGSLLPQEGIVNNRNHRRNNYCNYKKKIQANENTVWFFEESGEFPRFCCNVLRFCETRFLLEFYVKIEDKQGYDGTDYCQAACRVQVKIELGQPVHLDLQCGVSGTAPEHQDDGKAHKAEDKDQGSGCQNPRQYLGKRYVSKKSPLLSAKCLCRLLRMRIYPAPQT